MKTTILNKLAEIEATQNKKGVEPIVLLLLYLDIEILKSLLSNHQA